jgi:hypothetical protein
MDSRDTGNRALKAGISEKITSFDISNILQVWFKKIKKIIQTTGSSVLHP